MLLTIMIALAAWLGLNAAFVAIRFYLTADRASHVEHEFIRYPKLVN